MKNINLKLIQNGFVKFRSIGFAICFMFTIQHSYATITGPPGAASPVIADACQADAATSIQSVADDITLLQSLYSSDCASITIIASNEGPSMDPADDDCSWEYFRNYTINENGGSGCNSVITVTVEHLGGDDSAPTGSFANITGVNDCLANAAAFDAAGVAAGYTDNCATLGASNVTLTSTVPSGDDCMWTVTYNYTVVDDCNKSVAGSYSVSGADLIAPTGATTASTTGNNACFADLADIFSFEAALAVGGYSDGCAVTLSAVETGSEVITGGDCAVPGGWTVTYTFKVVDGCGNELTGQTYTHTGADSSAPTGTPPTGTSGIDACFANALTATPFDPGAAAVGYSDDCNNVNIVPVSSTPLGDDCNWTVTHIFHVDDDCGNRLPNQQYTDSGSDQTAPVGTPPTGTSGIDACFANALTAASFNPVAAAVGYSDVCNIVNIVPVSSTRLGNNCNWMVKHIFHVDDDCGNRLPNQEYTDSGLDLTGPLAFDVPDDQYFSTTSDCNQNVAITKPTVTDACGEPVVLTIASNDPGLNLIENTSNWTGLFSVGETELTITATDACGNQTVDMATITVVDNVDPVISFCPGAPAAVFVAAGSCGANVTLKDAEADDNCTLISLVISYGPGNPTGACTAAPAATSFPATRTLTGNDATGGDLITANFGNGVTRVTYTFTDNAVTTTTPAGPNVSSCFVDVQVIDDKRPTVATPAAIADQDLKTSTGATCPGTGLTGTTTPPVIATGPVTFGSQFTVAGKTFTAPAMGVFTDNCGVVSMSATVSTDVSDDCKEVVTVTWDVADCNGNTLLTPVAQEFEIEDDQAPTSAAATDIMNGSNPVNACKPVNTNAADAYFNNAAKDQILALYTDNCQTLVRSDIVLLPTVASDITGNDCNWTIAHTFKIEDGCGNSTSNREFITEGGDKSAPTGFEPADVTGINDCMPNSTTDAISSYFNAATIAMAYTDAVCSGQSVATDIKNVSAVIPMSSTNCNWTVTFTYDVEDGCNNLLEDESFTVSGGDMTKPTNINTVVDLTDINGCSDPVEAKAAAEAASSVASEIAKIATDNQDCGSTVTVTLNSESVIMGGTDCGSAFGNGGWIVERIYTVEDGCNNVSDPIVVQHQGYSQKAPTFGSMQPDITISAGSNCNASVDISYPTGNESQCGDMLGASALELIDVPVGAFASSDDMAGHWSITNLSNTNTLRIKLTDACGNISYDDFVITVIGGTPSFTGPAPNKCPFNIVDTDGTCNNPYPFTISFQENCGTTGSVVDVSYSGNSVLPSNQTGLLTGATVSENYFPGTTTVTLTLRNPALGSPLSSCSFTVSPDPSCGFTSPCVPVTEVLTMDINGVGPANMPALFQASQTTKSDDVPYTTGTVVSSGQNVAFFGGTEVLLLPGFDVQLGATFLADIVGCP